MKKRFFLITTGTIGGLGAVLAVTPPQFGGANGLAVGGQGSASTSGQNSNPAQTTTQNSTPSPSTSATKTTKAKPGKSAATTNSQSTPPPDPTPTPTPTPKAQSAGVKTITGDPFQADEGRRSWGTVRVKVTFTDGAITAINGMQSPTSRGQYAFDQLDPYVGAQKITIAAIKSKSSNALPYVSGASYTCIAYWDSLKTAIQKAGL
jgi:uncharacterized protein with FMN-binding domain